MFSFRWKNKACIKRFDPKISSLSVCRIYDLYAEDVDVIFVEQIVGILLVFFA